MLSFLSASRRRQLSILAEQERSLPGHRYTALILAFLYNVAGFADIFSTQYAIYTGAGVEANPVIRTIMESFSWHNAWIVFKLCFQFLVTAMVIWFPNRIVMAFFAFVVVITGSVAIQNMVIGGLL